MNKARQEQQISIRFPLDVLQVIREMAKQEERSFNGQVIWMLREQIMQRKAKQG